jgi:putative copper export protein/mono/diheme cytochrome c family protein
LSTLQTIAAGVRGAHVAALVSLFGTLLFVLLILGGGASAAGWRLRRLAWISAASALFFGLGWLVTEAAAIVDAGNLAAALAASPVVAFQTHYGRWFVLRCALLAIVLVLPLGRHTGLVAAVVLAGLALGVQPMLGHAGALGGRVGAELIGSELLHLLAAGAWLGGLLPLFIAIGMLPGEAAASACRSFTPIGVASVLLLAGTAMVQVTALMGGLPGLLGTEYGHVALLKLVLFVMLLVLAALNRFVFTERLTDGTSHAAHRRMRVSIAIEMLLGIAVIITAGFLASLTPGTHEQPVWPLPWRASLTAALSDPPTRRQLLAALAAIGTACAAFVCGLIWRRVRWQAFALTVVLVGLAIPRLGLLFVDAYPTSFFTSPTEFAATAIARGARLFGVECAGCHGVDGHGDGVQAKTLPLAPADLTAAHFQAHSDGDLYWFIGHGFTMPDGTTAMPGFAGRLSSEAIWDLIDFLRAHYAGATMRQLGAWSVPVAMPQFDAQCASGRRIDLDDLRGRAVRVIALGGLSAEDGRRSVDAATIIVARNDPPKPSDDACVATEPQLWTALAIILGMSPDDLAGTQFLVDQNGWLRAAWRAGEGRDWDNTRVLTERLHDILAHPLTVPVPSEHHH